MYTYKLERIPDSYESWDRRNQTSHAQQWHFVSQQTLPEFTSYGLLHPYEIIRSACDSVELEAENMTCNLR